MIVKPSPYALEAFCCQCFHLHRCDLKSFIRNDLNRRLNALKQNITRRCVLNLTKTEKLVGGGAESGRYPNKCTKIRFTIPANVVCVATLTKPATPCGFCVGYTQCFRAAPQTPTKYIHRNVLFWNFTMRYELFVGSIQTVLFLSSRSQQIGGPYEQEL